MIGKLNLMGKNKKKFVIISILAVVVLIGVSVISSMTVFANAGNPLKVYGQNVKSIASKQDMTVVARVGNTSILKENFDAFKQSQKLNPENKLSDRQILDKLIDRQVWYDQAVKSKITATDDEVNKMMADTKTAIANNAELSREFNDYMSGLGIKAEDYWQSQKANYKKAFIISKYKSELRTGFKQKESITDSNKLESSFNSYCNTLTSKFRSDEKIEYFIK